MTTPPTQRRDVSLALQGLYDDASAATRALQSCRPYICPFEVLVDQVPRGSSVFDLGCGGGLLLGLLARRGVLASGLGVDVSASAVRQAEAMRRRLPDPSLVSFVELDDAFLWPERRFDVACAIDVFHHIDPNEQEEYLVKLAGVVRPGGLLLYKDIAEQPRWRAWANRLHDLVVARQWVNYFPSERLHVVTRGCGLELVHEAYIPRLWYGHHLALFRLGPTADLH